MQRCLGTTEDALCVPTVDGMPGHADADLQEQIATIDKERSLDRISDELGKFANLRVVFYTGYKDREFISTEASDDRHQVNCFVAESPAETIAY